jgi:hypothetical protein
MMLLKTARFIVFLIVLAIMIANTQRYEQKYLGLPH